MIALLAFFLLLTLVAFRRQDTIKDVVSNGLHRNNSMASVVVADIKANTSADTKTNPTTDSKFDETDSTSIARLQSDPPIELKGPKLDNSDRILAPRSLTDLHNRSLGVRELQAM